MSLCPDVKSQTKAFGRFDLLQICEGYLFDPVIAPAGTEVLNKGYIDGTVAGASPNAEYLLDVACGCLVNAKGLTTLNSPLLHGIRKTSTATDTTLRLEPNVVMGAVGPLDLSTTGFLCASTANANYVWTNSLAEHPGVATYPSPLFTGFTNVLSLCSSTRPDDSSAIAPWSTQDCFIGGGSIRLAGTNFNDGSEASVIFGQSAMIPYGVKQTLFCGDACWSKGANNYVTGSGNLMVTEATNSILIGAIQVINSPNVLSTPVGVIGIGFDERAGSAGTGTTLDRQIFIGTYLEGLGTFANVADTLFFNLGAAPIGTYFYGNGTKNYQRNYTNALEVYAENVVIGCDPATTGVEFIDACPRTAAAPTIGDQLTNKTYVDAAKAAKEAAIALDYYAVTHFSGVYNILTTDEFVIGTGTTNTPILPLASGVTVGKYWLIRQQGGDYMTISVSGTDEIMSRDGTVITSLRIYAGEAIFIHRQTTVGNVVYFIA